MRKFMDYYRMEYKTTIASNSNDKNPHRNDVLEVEFINNHEVKLPSASTDDPASERGVVGSLVMTLINPQIISLRVRLFDSMRQY